MFARSWAPPETQYPPVPPGLMSSALSQRKGGCLLIHGSTSWGSLVIWTVQTRLPLLRNGHALFWVKLHYLLIVLPRCKLCLCIGASCGQGNTYVLPELAFIFLERVTNSRREVETIFQLGGATGIGDRWSRSWLTRGGALGRCSLTSGLAACAGEATVPGSLLCRWRCGTYTEVSKHFY